MKFKYLCLTQESGSKLINIHLKDGDEPITFILWDTLKSINPVDEMLTPFEERFRDIWELSAQSAAGYFKEKIELPYNDVWITGSPETITTIDLLLQKDERFERLVNSCQVCNNFTAE